MFSLQFELAGNDIYNGICKKKTDSCRKTKLVVLAILCFNLNQFGGLFL